MSLLTRICHLFLIFAYVHCLLLENYNECNWQQQKLIEVHTQCANPVLQWLSVIDYDFNFSSSDSTNPEVLH